MPSPSISPAESDPVQPDTGKPRFFIELRPLSSLAAIRDAWQTLAARALEPNIFYEPAFALAAAPVFGSGVEVALVWTDSSRRELLGFFPMGRGSWREGFTLSLALGWTHPYAPLGTPLVSDARAAEAIGAWLDFVALEPGLPKRLLLPFVPTGGAFARVLAVAIAERRGRLGRFGTHARALLAPPGDRAGYLDRALSAKKRKELARQRRRLADSGAVTPDIAASADAVSAALDEFMTIEQNGWKGRAGSAAAQDPAHTRFMRQAIVALAENRQARVVRLMVGGRPAAAGILLQSGASGWFWKIAYDEEAARLSPGVQLALDLTRVALADAMLDHVDSCATAGHPMIEPLWRERLTLADYLVVPGRGYPLAWCAEMLRRGAFRAARALRNRLREFKRARAASGG